MLLDVLEGESRERLEAQKKVNQLMREYLSLEFERELQRLTEELESEREGHTHNHRERQRLGAELERERLARSGDQRNIHAFSETFRSGSSYSRGCSRLSRLRRRTLDRPLEKQQPLRPHRGIAQSHRSPLRDAEGEQHTCVLRHGRIE
jgi:hypothetical protein